MAPKTPKTPSDRPYGLNDAEVNATLHACKLLAEDGRVQSRLLLRPFPFLSSIDSTTHSNGKTHEQVDTEKLAQLTGHDKSHTAYCLWYVT